MHLTLENEVVLVTGAASGIGRAVAVACAAAGARVVALDRSGAGLDEFAAGVSDTGAEVFTCVTDVSDADAVDAAVAAGTASLGDVTVLVTAAAIDESVGIADMTRAQWVRMIDVNLHGTFYCLQAVLPGMRRAGRGRIILFGSNIALKGGSEIAHYGAAKGAIHALARCAALDLAPSNITVNVVAPGPVDTAMLRSLPPQWLADKQADMPMGRFGNVDEIVPTVLLLASSPGGSFYTGATLNVSGGDVLQ